MPLVIWIGNEAPTISGHDMSALMCVPAAHAAFMQSEWARPSHQVRTWIKYQCPDELATISALDKGSWNKASHWIWRICNSIMDKFWWQKNPANDILPDRVVKLLQGVTNLIIVPRGYCRSWLFLNKAEANKSRLWLSRKETYNTLELTDVGVWWGVDTQLKREPCLFALFTDRIELFQVWGDTSPEHSYCERTLVYSRRSMLSWGQRWLEQGYTVTAHTPWTSSCNFGLLEHKSNDINIELSPVRQCLWGSKWRQCPCLYKHEEISGDQARTS
jgi:hypothetical protein